MTKIDIKDKTESCELRGGHKSNTCTLMKEEIKVLLLGIDELQSLLYSWFHPSSPLEKIERQIQEKDKDTIWVENKEMLKVLDRLEKRFKS